MNYPYVDLLKNKLGVPNLRNGKWPLKSVRPEFGSSPQPAYTGCHAPVLKRDKF